MPDPAAVNAAQGWLSTGLLSSACGALAGAATTLLQGAFKARAEGFDAILELSGDVKAEVAVCCSSEKDDITLEQQLTRVAHKFQHRFNNYAAKYLEPQKITEVKNLGREIFVMFDHKRETALNNALNSNIDRLVQLLRSRWIRGTLRQCARFEFR